MDSWGFLATKYLLMGPRMTSFSQAMSSTKLTHVSPHNCHLKYDGMTLWPDVEKYSKGTWNVGWYPRLSSACRVPQLILNKQPTGLGSASRIKDSRPNTKPNVTK